MQIEDVTLYEAICHFTTIGWKVFFCIVPPKSWGGGWPAFLSALAMIGLITLVVSECATLLGCVIGLPGSITAITFVAIGTSLPDTFASMTAARSSEYADSAIGNVTGSNCVNVFLGLGLPWVISAHYNNSKLGQDYEMQPGKVSFSVMLFLITSIVCFTILIIRRVAVGGELGGPAFTKWASFFILVSLWVVYALFSSLNAVDIIKFGAQ